VQFLLNDPASRATSTLPVRRNVQQVATMPGSTAEIVIYVLWIVWLLYWIASALNVKATKWHESITSRAVHESLFAVCAILLALPDQLPEFIVRRIVPPSPMLELAGAIALAVGLSVTAWGRQCLGANWSGTVTVKEGHTLIRTGPYGLVRHPIYSGLLLGLGGTALTIGEWRGVFAVALALFALLWKIRVEEARMLNVFPEYQHYQDETWALIPFIF
jgi:protein-S-isoprenylcysteine O-methyltransferase Ste14